MRKIPTMNIVLNLMVLRLSTRGILRRSMLLSIRTKGRELFLCSFHYFFLSEWEIVEGNLIDRTPYAKVSS